MDSKVAKASQPPRLLIPRSPVRKIETRALSCLDACRQKLRLAAVPVPVPVEAWIEGPLGIRFGITDLSHLGPDVLGAVFTRERQILVSDKPLKNEGRFRFTCAHELGHLVLHSRVRKAFQDTDQEGWRSARRHEREADRFAGAFLMPTVQLERELVQVCRRRELDPHRTILELMRNSVTSNLMWKKIVLPDIASRFKVSLTAAVIRFADMELSNGRPFLRRHRIRDLLPPAVVALLDRPTEPLPDLRAKEA